MTRKGVLMPTGIGGTMLAMETQGTPALILLPKRSRVWTGTDLGGFAIVIAAVLVLVLAYRALRRDQEANRALKYQQRWGQAAALRAYERAGKQAEGEGYSPNTVAARPLPPRQQ